MKRLVSTALVSALTVGTPWIALAQDGGDAAEQPQDDFAALTNEATAAFQAGELEKAVDLFQKAYALKNVSNILYNIARIHEKLGNIDEAISYYDQFVVAPNVEQSARKDALERLKTLREIKAMKEEPKQPEVAPEPEPEPEPQPAAEPEAEPNTLAYVFLGVGGASLIGSAVFGLVTQGHFNDFEDAENLDDRQSAASAGKTTAVVSDALLVTGVVTGVLGVIFLLSGGGEEDPASTAGAFQIPGVGTARLSPAAGQAWGLNLSLDY